MTNLIYQGKINRQFWGKFNSSIYKKYEKKMFTICYLGGAITSKLSNKITFFHSVKRIE